MRGRLYLNFSALALAMLSSGCIQATRHSNTMLFGTNTKFGLSVGTSPANIPEINVGYSRQEAVVLPLVANAGDDGQVQKPCDISSGVDGAGRSKFVVHPCSLVAVRNEALDSYSVLASFGAEFDGSATPSDAKAKGGLAQYFATGMAAQILALNGGASLVAVGAAAVKSAEQEPPSAAALQAMFGGEVAFAQGAISRKGYRLFRDKILAKILLTDPNNLQSEISKFESKIGVGALGVAKYCTSTEECQSAIRDRDPYMPFYPDDPDKLQSALDAWKEP